MSTGHFHQHQQALPARAGGPTSRANNVADEFPAAAALATTADRAKGREMVRETMAYVAEQSPDIDVWMAHSRRLKSKALNSRTFMLRLVIVLLCFTSMLVDVIAVAVSAYSIIGSGGDGQRDLPMRAVARTLAIIAAFLVTIVANVVGGGGGSLQIFVLLCTACLLLDASMMSLVSGSDVLFVIGIIAIVFRLAAIAVGIRGVRRDGRVALTEQLYLHLGDEELTEEMASFEGAVQRRLGLSGPSFNGGGGINDKDYSSEDDDEAGSDATLNKKAAVVIEADDLHSGAASGGKTKNKKAPFAEAAVTKDILRAMVQQMEALYDEYREAYELTVGSRAASRGSGLSGEEMRANSAGVLQVANRSASVALGASGSGGGSFLLGPATSAACGGDMGIVRAAIREKKKSDKRASISLSADSTLVVGGGANGTSAGTIREEPATTAAADLRPRSDTIVFQNDTLNWLRLARFREAMHARDRFFTNLIICFLFVLFALTAGNVGFEFWKIFANQSPLFPKNDSGDNPFLDRGLVRRTSFPARAATGLKVHIVVVDGLRDDFTFPGASTIGDFLNEPSFAADSLKFSARAQLPSFSVPNWMSILSGSPPEDSGVTGNLQNGETHYDTLYGIAKAYGVHSGMTGTPWWANLVASALPPLGGDGTIATSERPDGVAKYEWSSGDLADKMRGAVAVEAALRSRVANPFGSSPLIAGAAEADDDGGEHYMYELFLTHFSDVDMQGHDYGMDKKWNKRDSYRGAVANKTALIRELLAAIDNKTVLIVTSDHGHVERGGHGGEDSVLRDVPMVFYQRGSGAGSKQQQLEAQRNFPADEEPRWRYNGKYSNLDLSATVTALLGLPSPRQSLGVFIEEALEAFLPADSASAASPLDDPLPLNTTVALRRRCFHDLLLAKINLVKGYKDLLDDTFFDSAIPAVFVSDPMLAHFAENEVPFDPTGGANMSSSVPSIVRTAANLTEHEYADLVRLALKDYDALRNRRFDIVFWRNFALSVCAAVPSLVILVTSYMHSPFVRIRSIAHPRHPNFAANLQQLLGAVLSVTAYAFLSLATYMIIYFGAVGQRQWDPTAVHTPSVAVRYLASVIVAPVIFFTLVTKVWLWRCNCIHWRTPEAAAEFRALRKKLNIFFIFRWASHHVPRDIATVLLVTREFKASGFLKAHLYTQYLAFVVALTSLILLFLCFPFTFFLPIVFNVSHVSEFNTVYRFRVITVMFMFIPMQVGTMVMLAMRPPASTASNARMWDEAFAEGRLAGDAYEMGTSVAKGVLHDAIEAQRQLMGGAFSNNAANNDNGKRGGGGLNGKVASSAAAFLAAVTGIGGSSGDHNTSPAADTSASAGHNNNSVNPISGGVGGDGDADGDGGYINISAEEALLAKAASLEHDKIAQQYAFILELKRLIRDPLYRTNPLALAPAEVLSGYSSPTAATPPPAPAGGTFPPVAAVVVASGGANDPSVFSQPLTPAAPHAKTASHFSSTRPPQRTAKGQAVTSANFTSSHANANSGGVRASPAVAPLEEVESLDVSPHRPQPNQPGVPEGFSP